MEVIKHPFLLQRFDASGNKITSDIQTLITSPSQEIGLYSASATPDGGFVVAYKTAVPSSGYSKAVLNVAKFDASGAQQDSSVQIAYSDPPFAYFLNNAKIDVLSDGRILVAWTTVVSSVTTVKAEILANDLSVSVAPFIVAQNAQSVDDIIPLSNGGYQVLWAANFYSSVGYYVGHERISQYDAQSNAVGASQVIGDIQNSAYGFLSSITLLDGRHFVLYNDTSGKQSGQFYSANGTPQGSPITVFNNINALVNGSALASTPDGGFIALYDNTTNQASSGFDLIGQRFAADGTPMGSQFTVANDAGAQYNPQIIFNADGSFRVYFLTEVAGGGTVATASAYRDFASTVAFVNEDQTGNLLPITATLTDTDGSETLSVRLTGFPAGGTFNVGALQADGSWLIASPTALQLSSMTFTPPANYSGTFNLTVTALSTETSNGSTASTSTTMAVYVAPVNDAPVAVADVYSGTAVVEAGSAVAGQATASGNVLTNDTDVDAGDSKTVTTAGTFSGTYGTLQINADGSYIYTLDNNLAATQALTQGQQVNEVFSYTMKDTAGLTSSSTLTIGVTGTNDAPVVSAVAETGERYEGGNWAANLLAGTDVDSSNLTFQIVANSATNGTVSHINASTGYYIFTPTNADYFGPASFQYRISDGITTSSPKTVNLTFVPVNDAPVVTGETLSSVKEDSGTRIISFASLLGNDSRGAANEGGQTLTITALSNIVGGTAVINGTNIEFTPTANFNGTASFSYTVQDNGQSAGVDNFKTATGTASFTVTAVPDAPVGTSSTISVAEDGARVLTTADFGFSDPNDTPANSLTGVVIASLPGAGTLTNNGAAVTAGNLVSIADINAGRLVYTPVANANGSGYASFTFQVQDSATVVGQVVRNEFQIASGWTGTSVAPWGWGTIMDSPSASPNQSALAFAEGGRTIETDSANQPNAIAVSGATYRVGFDFYSFSGAPISNGALLTVDLYAGATKLGTRNFVYNSSNSRQSFDYTTPVSAGDAGTKLKLVFSGIPFAIDNVSLTQIGGTGANLLVNGDFGPGSYYVGGNVDATARTLTIDVTPVNDAPVAVADVYSGTAVVEAGSAVAGQATASGNVLTNDTDVDAGDSKTVTTAGTFSGTYGTLQLNADGSYIYTLDNNLAATQALTQGQQVNEVFSYTMKDGAGATSSATLTIGVTGSHDAAVIGSPVNASVTEDMGVTGGNLTATGTLSITDVDSSATFSTTVTGVNSPWGTLTLAANGAYTYSVSNSDSRVQALNTGQTRVDTFRVTSADGTTRDLSFTINGSNDAPTLPTGDGIVTSNISTGADRMIGILAQSDGKIVVSGFSTVTGTAMDFSIARYNADGSLDTSFNSTGFNIVDMAGPQDAGFRVVMQSDGKYIVAGQADTTSTDDFALVRFNSNGTLDTTFGTNGKVVTTSAGNTDQAREAVVQPDGKIIVVGYYSMNNLNEGQDVSLVRYTSNGTLDTTFGNNGRVVTGVGPGTANDQGRAIHLLADGKILVGGFTDNGTDFDFVMLRYNANGTLDSTFGTGGISKIAVGTGSDVSYDFAVQPDGKIVMSGFGSNGTNNDFEVVRLNADGSLDTGFGTGGKVMVPMGTNDSSYAIALQSDGKIIVFGHTNSGGQNDIAVMRLTTSGALDSTFGTGGKVVFSTPSLDEYNFAATVQLDGKILLAGSVINGGSEDFLLMRLNSDGSLDTTFDVANSLGGFVTYTENAAAVVLDSSVAFSDTELNAASNYGSSTLTLARSGGANAQDQFVATGTLGALTEGAALTLGGVTVGTVTTNSNGTLVLTFANGTTQAQVNAVSQLIGYANSSEAPSSSAVIGWTFSDGNSGVAGAAQTVSGTTTVVITPVNDAAVIGNPTVASVTEDTSVTAGNLTATGTLSITDVDSSATFSTSVTGVNSPWGTLTLAANGAYTYSVSNSDSRVQALNTGQSQIDTFRVTSADGTTKDLSFTINGVDEAVVVPPTPQVSTVDLASLGTSGFQINGATADDTSGFSVSSAGDVNGDGYGDLLIGAYLANPTLRNDAGSSYVIFGKASGLGTIDLANLGTSGFRINGALARDYSGRSVSSAGDVNGDGYGDIIIGANGADPSTKTDAGSSYVIFGKRSGFGTIDLASLGTSGFRIDGATAGDNSGRSVSSAGDVNGDGYGDIIVGAYAADPSGRSNAGSSYVVYGKASGFGTIDLANLGTSGFQINGAVANDFSGYAVSSAGDINGDGYGDLLIGAYLAGPSGRAEAGSSYVVYGKASGLGTIDLANLGTSGFQLNGAVANDRSGISVSSAGDVNGDGYGDIIIGAHLAYPSGNTGAGSSYVIFGKASGLGTIDLANLGTSGFQINGAVTNDRSGISVSSAGDVNGDGYGDLIIGANQADPSGRSNAGSSYVVYGKASGFGTIDLANLGTSGFQINGAVANDLSGYSVSAAGDVDGDGYDDLIVGAYGANPSGKNDAGSSYVIFGDAQYGGSTVAMTVTGTAANETLFGKSGADTISGGGGNDTIQGGLGADRLTGGAGADVFGYDSRYHGDDTIVDFTSGSDKIAILNSLVGTSRSGTLDASGKLGGTGNVLFESVAGNVAGSNASTKLIYDATNHDLYFDADGGNTTSGRTLLAHLENGASITATDIRVVA